MLHGLKESYMHGSKHSGGEKELDRVVIREADNGGFIVKVEYTIQRKQKGDVPTGTGYEETETVYESWDKVADFLEEIYGDGGEES